MARFGAKGQSGLEFLMTYGWVILVIAVIFVVIWQWGLFSFSSRIEKGSFGFWGVTPQDFLMRSNGVLRLSLLNTVGANVTLLGVNASMMDGTDSVCGRLNSGATFMDEPLMIGRGKSTTVECAVEAFEAGDRFEEFIKIVYNDTRVVGYNFTSSGRIWGNVELSS
ncbi:MAG TPA: hypothetical protein ENN13_03005 [Candidatus Altiarchaeales archaeon]|nr:hypothetical protein [Candidatus Altiarchaeales archaeon]